MYSLSTSWNSRRHKDGPRIISEITAAGFKSVELDWSLTANTVRDILLLKKSGRIKISSLHNMCPIPDGIEPRMASPDYYSLASLDEKERELAIYAAMTTIDYAEEFEAGAVILHLGRVDTKDRTRELDSVFDDKEKFYKLRDDAVREREENEDGYFKNALKSLDELVPYALRSGVPLAIENRYYYSEIPAIQETEKIFASFGPGSLYYWHDVGHAEVFERLGFARHEDFLDKFSDRLIGVHLHDIIGRITDHNAPGFGSFDFGILKRYISKDTIKVIEAHGPVSAAQLRQSVDYLDKVLG